MSVVEAAGRVEIMPVGEEDFEGVLEIGLGEPSVDLQATAYSAEGETDAVAQEFAWSVSREGVVSGRLLTGDTSLYNIAASAGGEVTVYATAADGSGVRGEIQVRVISPIRYFSLPATARVEVGGQTTLDPEFGPADATYGALEDFDWKSENEEIATVENGVITGVSEGKTRVTATTHNGLTGSCTVYVGETARGVTLQLEGVEGYEPGEVLELPLGHPAVYIKARAYDDDGTEIAGVGFDWTADKYGVFLGWFISYDTSECQMGPVGVGEATFRATCKSDPTLYYDLKIRVILPIDSFTLPETLQLGVGGETELVPTVVPANATYAQAEDFAWESDDPETVSVENGVITAHKTGTARITATSHNGLTSTCTVSVVIMADSVDIAPVGGETSTGAADIDIGETGRVLQATAYGPSGSADFVLQEFAWTVSPSNIVALYPESDGSRCKIVPLALGTTTVYATATDGSGARGAFEITVVREMTELTLPQSAEVAIGKTLTLSPTFTPADATRKELTWESSNEKIATVENGVVIPGSEPGETVITATSVYYPELTASCAVKVGYAPTAIAVEPTDSAAVYAEDTFVVYVGRTLTLDCAFPDAVESDHLLGDLTWNIDSGANFVNLTVNDDGSCTLTGLAAGTVDITAASRHDSDVRASVRVIVALPLTGISLADCSIPYADQHAFTLQMTITPTNATLTNYADFLWMSSNEDVVTVENGVCTVQGTGVAYVSVQARNDPNVVAGCTVRVYKPTAAIGIVGLDDDFNPVEINGQATLGTGSYLQLYAAAFEEGYDVDSGAEPGASQQFVWTSSNPSLVEIHSGSADTGDANGAYCLVHAVQSTGSDYVAITASAMDGSGVYGVFYVRVVDPMTGIGNVPAEVFLYVGDTYAFDPQPEPADYADYQGFVWHDVKERDQRIVTMEGDTVTAVGPGKVELVVYPLRQEAVSAACTVTVYQYVESILLEGGRDVMAINETIALTATALGGDGSSDFIAEPSVSWLTSDPRVATVSGNGVVTAVGSGEVTITAVSRENPAVYESVTIQVTSKSA